jgi:hypothetical protein
MTIPYPTANMTKQNKKTPRRRWCRLDSNTLADGAQAAL